YLSGGDGGDIYDFSLGDGQDTIADGQTNVLITDGDAVAFGAGIAPTDVNFTRSGGSNDLVITIDGDATDSLTIAGQFAATDTGVLGLQWFNRIETFVFDGGTGLAYSWQDIDNMILANEEAIPNNTIYGFATDDYLDPGAGMSDELVGGNGNDTYVFGL